MWKYLLAAVLALGLTSSSAQVPMTGAGKGAPASGGGPLVFTATDVSQPWQSSSIALPVTFSANIGTASSDRRVIVVIAVDGSLTQGVLSAVTINGVNANKDVGIDPNSQGIYIYSALVTSGSGAQSIVINGSGAFPNGVGIAVGTITGSATSSLSATNSVGLSNLPDPHSLTTVVPTNGVGIVGVCTDRAFTPVWTNATGDANLTEPNHNTMSLQMAHTTNNSPSFTGANNFGVAMVAATYAP